MADKALRSLRFRASRAFATALEHAGESVHSLKDLRGYHYVEYFRAHC
jgi:hypothetical protein